MLSETLHPISDKAPTLTPQEAHLLLGTMEGILTKSRNHIKGEKVIREGKRFLRLDPMRLTHLLFSSRGINVEKVKEKLGCLAYPSPRFRNEHSPYDIDISALKEIAKELQSYPIAPSEAGRLWLQIDKDTEKLEKFRKKDPSQRAKLDGLISLEVAKEILGPFPTKRFHNSKMECMSDGHQLGVVKEELWELKESRQVKQNSQNR